MKKDLKVAIVCDWLTNVGGAEKVLLYIHKMFPKAPIFTSQYDPKELVGFRMLILGQVRYKNTQRN